MKNAAASFSAPMVWSLTPDDLAAYVAHQLNFFAPPGTPFQAADLALFLPETRSRVETCFRGIRKKYFLENGRPVFSHLHGDHFAMFLYLLGNTIHRAGGRSDLVQTTFLLNKMLHGVDAYPTIELPRIFLFVHPLGTVLGNAGYKDYFMVYQNCTVGSTSDGIYPQFDEGTVLFSKTSVIGRCQVGHDVVFGANSFVLNTDIPSETTVIGCHPACRLISSPERVADRYFSL